jgi:hypothetical protein
MWKEARELISKGVPSSFQDAPPQPLFMEGQRQPDLGRGRQRVRRPPQRFGGMSSATRIPSRAGLVGVIVKPIDVKGVSQLSPFTRRPLGAHHRGRGHGSEAAPKPWVDGCSRCTRLIRPGHRRATRPRTRRPLAFRRTRTGARDNLTVGATRLTRAQHGRRSRP